MWFYGGGDCVLDLVYAHVPVFLSCIEGKREFIEKFWFVNILMRCFRVRFVGCVPTLQNSDI